MWVEIEILMRVFMKNPHTKCLEIGGEWPQLYVPMRALWEFSPFLSFSLSEELWRGYPSIQKSCEYCESLDTLIALRTPSREPCKYVFSYIIDDSIICSSCLNVMNTKFNVFRCIQHFDQNFEKFIDLKTQQKLHIVGAFGGGLSINGISLYKIHRNALH